MRLIDAIDLHERCLHALKQRERDGQDHPNSFLSGRKIISTEWWCVEDIIYKMPTVHAKDVYHAIWTDFGDYVSCSRCGKPYRKGDERYYYCPNCGARMDE